jgi:hypothetical protein
MIEVMRGMEGAVMQTLKSKKISLAILAAVLSLNWYVGVQAVKHDQYDASSSPIHMNAPMSYMPSLDAMQLPPSLASVHLNGFRDRLLSIQELPAFAFTFTPHVAPSTSIPQQTMQQEVSTARENQASMMIVESHTLPANIEANDRKPAASIARMPGDAPQSKSRQSGDLLKVLALYYMLNR